MSDDPEHKCHCAHVVVIRERLTILWVLLGFVAASVAALLITKVGENISIRIRDAPPAPFPGERMGSERIPPPQQGANGR